MPLVRIIGLEPMAFGLKIRCSSAELHPYRTRQVAALPHGFGFTRRCSVAHFFAVLAFWCLRQESNLRRRDFRSLALPTELPRHITRHRVFSLQLLNNNSCGCLFCVEGGGREPPLKSIALAFSQKLPSV